MATIREIAEMAGVSRSTVSLVINKSPLVKEETRKKVEKVIADANYVPNPTARNLSLKVTKSLGIIVLSDQQRTTTYDFNSTVGLFSLGVIRGIASGLDKTEYGMLIEYYYAPEDPDGIPKLIRERKIDGAFIVGGYCSEAFISKLRSQDVPFVTVAVGAPEEICDSVVSNPLDGAKVSMKYLIEAGKKNIGFLNCPTSFRSAHQRVIGVAEAVKESGIKFPKENMMFSYHNNGISGYETMKNAWESGLRFDAFAAANPQLALGAIRYLDERGLCVPEDVSVVAYEDNSLCGYTTPALTAINIQKEKMGEEAVLMLLRRLKNPLLPRQSEEIPLYLVERDSVSKC